MKLGAKALGWFRKLLRNAIFFRKWPNLPILSLYSNEKTQQQTIMLDWNEVICILKWISILRSFCLMLVYLSLQYTLVAASKNNQKITAKTPQPQNEMTAVLADDGLGQGRLTLQKIIVLPTWKMYITGLRFNQNCNQYFNLYTFSCVKKQYMKVAEMSRWRFRQACNID